VLDRRAIEIASAKHFVNDVFSAALLRRNAFLQGSHQRVSSSERLLPNLLKTLSS
jgi:hypothetical protein